MTKPKIDKLPIGYYLKKTDNLLTEGINKIHEEFSITRTDWQILNLISENTDIDRQEITKLLSEFNDEAKINTAVSSLLSRQLIVESEYFLLTKKGENLYQTCFQKQKEFRAKAMENITDIEYLQVIETLENMIANLEK